MEELPDLAFAGQIRERSLVTPLSTVTRRRHRWRWHWNHLLLTVEILCHPGLPVRLGRLSPPATIVRRSTDAVSFSFSFYYDFDEDVIFFRGGGNIVSIVVW